MFKVCNELPERLVEDLFGKDKEVYSSYNYLYNDENCIIPNIFDDIFNYGTVKFKEVLEFKEHCKIGVFCIGKDNTQINDWIDKENSKLLIEELATEN